MRLWLRVALVVALVSVVALLLTGAVAVQVAGSSATRDSMRAQERDALALASVVRRWLDEQGDVLLGWALVFGSAELDEARRTGLAKAVLAGVPSTVTVVLVDADGGLVAPPQYIEAPADGRDWIPGSPERADALVRDLPLTAALEDPRGVAFGEARQHGPGAVPTLPVAVVASRDPVMVLGAEVALAVADDLARGSTADRAVVLVDARGRGVVGHEHPLVHLGGLRPLLGTLASVSYEADGREVRGALAPAGTSGFSVLVLEPAEVALSGANAIWWRVVPVVGGAMFLSIAAGLVLGRTVTEPLARLRDTASAIAEGRFGARADIETRDEVGELASAFNAMSARLLANREEITRQNEAIEAFNRELQDRVDEATRSLREAQEQLVRSGQLAAVAQIGAGLAHELNNPLMAVLGLAQVVEHRASDPALAAVARDLREEADRCREVVRTMLRLADPADPDPAHVDVGLVELVDEVTSAVGAVVRRRGVALAVGAVPAVHVRMDASAGVRAVGALVTALAASLPPDATLSLDGAVDGDAAVLTFRPSALAGREDEWMASGLEVWVARRALESLEARLTEPTGEDPRWTLRLPLARS